MSCQCQVTSRANSSLRSWTGSRDINSLTRPGTAQLQGSTLTINDDDPGGDALLPNGQYAAQLSGDTLTIALPETDGTVHSYDCPAGAIDQYNQDVTNMQEGVQAAHNAAASAAVASAQASASASASAAAQAQAILSKEETTCAQAGGTWDT